MNFIILYFILSFQGTFIYGFSEQVQALFHRIDQDPNILEKNFKLIEQEVAFKDLSSLEKSSVYYYLGQKKKQLNYSEAIELFLMSSKLNSDLKYLSYYQILNLSCIQFFKSDDCAKHLAVFESFSRPEKLDLNGYKVWLQSNIVLFLSQKKIKESLIFFKKNRYRLKHDYDSWYLNLYYQILSYLPDAPEWCEYYKQWMLNRRDLIDFQFPHDIKKCQIFIKDKIHRIRHLISNNYEEKAKHDIETYIALYQPSLAEQKFIWAEFYYRAHYFEKSLEFINEALKLEPYHIEYLNLKANNLSRMGQLPDAVKVYEFIEQTSNDLSIKNQALFDRGFLLYQSQYFEEAEVIFKEYYKRASSKNKNFEALWYLAWIAYLKSNFSEAIDRFQKLIKLNYPERSKVIYWLAKALWKDYRYFEAEAYFNQLITQKNKQIMNYYSLLAQSFISQNRISYNFWQLLKGNLLLSDLNYELLIPYNYSQKLIDFDPQRNLASKKKSLSAKQRISLSENYENINKKILIYLRIGEDQLAIQLIKQQFQNLNLNWEHKINLLEQLWKFEEYYVLAQLTETYFSDLDGNNEYLKKYIFPKVFEPIVEEYSQRWQIDSRLIWSIMRAESFYNPAAESFVLAKGLMQLMPYTAEKMAKTVGIKSYEGPNSLFKADININLGVAYLARLKNQFQEGWPLVVAAYNAGPHRIKTWLHRFGYLDYDEFIEMIPFRETRNYVKKVYSFYHHYGGNFNLCQPISVRELAKVPEIRENWDDFID